MVPSSTVKIKWKQSRYNFWSQESETPTPDQVSVSYLISTAGLCYPSSSDGLQWPGWACTPQWEAATPVSGAHVGFLLGTRLHFGDLSVFSQSLGEIRRVCDQSPFTTYFAQCLFSSTEPLMFIFSFFLLFLMFNLPSFFPIILHNLPAIPCHN